jgi:Protein of unknown function (DUF3179)
MPSYGMSTARSYSSRCSIGQKPLQATVGTISISLAARLVSAALWPAPRKLTLSVAPKQSAGRFQDLETKSYWDVAGRCVDGELKGWTLKWVDSVQAKWFAWAAKYPETTNYKSETVPSLPKAR